MEEGQSFEGSGESVAKTSRDSPLVSVACRLHEINAAGWRRWTMMHMRSQSGNTTAAAYRATDRHAMCVFSAHQTRCQLSKGEEQRQTRHSG